MKRLLVIASFLLLAYGFAGFVGGALMATGVLKYNGELPLGDIQGFTVDATGNIYIASGGYGVIQAYSSEGDFLRHWSARANGGAFSIGLDNEQRVVVYTVRDPRVLVFDPNGNLISETSMKFDIMAQGTTPHSVVVNNISYELLDGLSPHIEQTGSEPRTIIDQPLYLDLIKSPMPAWILFAIGLVSNLILRKEELLAKLHGQRAR